MKNKINSFKIKKVNAVYEQDNKESMSKFLGKFILGLTKLFKEIKPDIIISESYQK